MAKPLYLSVYVDVCNVSCTISSCENGNKICLKITRTVTKNDLNNIDRLVNICLLGIHGSPSAICLSVQACLNAELKGCSSELCRMDLMSAYWFQSLWILWIWFLVYVYRCWFPRMTTSVAWWSLPYPSSPAQDEWSPCTRIFSADTDGNF